MTMQALPEGITPTDRLYWVMPDSILLDKDGWPRVAFTVDQAARFFFARSGSWLRLKMKADGEHPDTWFVQGGKRMEFYRKDSYEKGKRALKGDLSARFFTLADIEPMAHSLYLFEAIDERKLRIIIDLVKAEAELHGIPVE